MYHHVVVAGTFDHLHAGHRKLLSTAFEHGKKVSLGIMKEPLNNKMLSSQIQSFDTRSAQIRHFIQENHWQDRVTFFELHDPYGIALHDTTLEALIMTAETRKNADAMNAERKIRSLPELTLIEVEPVLAEDQLPISSTRIRCGEINRKGLVYKNLFGSARFQDGIPEKLRHAVSQPRGIVLKGSEKDHLIAAYTARELVQKEKPPVLITIGDVVTQTLFSVGITPDISIIDHKTRRTELKQPKNYGADIIIGPIANYAGFVSEAAAQVVIQALHDSLHDKKHREIVIDGEEDLLGIPVVMTAPLGSVFVYGQYGTGIIWVEVTEEQKDYYLPFLL